MVFNDEDIAGRLNSSGVVTSTSSRNRTITASPYAARAIPREKMVTFNRVSMKRYKKAKNQGLKFIYFSSILAGISNNDYYNHNSEMESLIKNNSDNLWRWKLPGDMA